MANISYPQLVHNIGVAIKEKAGLDSLKYGEMTQAILDIPSGGETADVTVKFMDGEDLYQLSSVKTGCGVYAPTINPTPPNGYSFWGWFDGETHQPFGYDYKTPIVYLEDKVLNARFLTDFTVPIYEHFNVSKAEYPYVVICLFSSSNISTIRFVKEYKFQGSTLEQKTPAFSLRLTNQYKLSSITTIEKLIDYIETIENYTFQNTGAYDTVNSEMWTNIDCSSISTDYHQL